MNLLCCKNRAELFSTESIVLLSHNQNVIDEIIRRKPIKSNEPNQNITGIPSLCAKVTLKTPNFQVKLSLVFLWMVVRLEVDDSWGENGYVMIRALLVMRHWMTACPTHCDSMLWNVIHWISSVSSKSYTHLLCCVYYQRGYGNVFRRYMLQNTSQRKLILETVRKTNLHWRLDLALWRNAICQFTASKQNVKGFFPFENVTNLELFHFCFCLQLPDTWWITELFIQQRFILSY